MRLTGIAVLVLALGACGWFLEYMEPDDVGSALTMAAWETWLAAEEGQSQANEISGPFGGTAAFDFTVSDPGYTGTVTFSDFVVRADPGETYTISGTADLFVDFKGDLSDFHVQYDGTLSIAWDGGSEATYEIDLGIVMAVVFTENETVAMEGSTTGTINEEYISVDFSTEFEGSDPAVP
jgi:hypothetical protein